MVREKLINLKVSEAEALALAELAKQLGYSGMSALIRALVRDRMVRFLDDPPANCNARGVVPGEHIYGPCPVRIYPADSDEAAAETFLAWISAVTGEPDALHGWRYGLMKSLADPSGREYTVMVQRRDRGKPDKTGEEGE